IALFVVMVIGLVIVITLSELQQTQLWEEDWRDNWVAGDPYLKVWANPETKVYYAPSDTAFGNTVPGFYLSQAEARRTGYKSTSIWGWGYGTNPKPLKTLTNLASMSGSRLSWTAG